VYTVEDWTTFHAAIFSAGAKKKPQIKKPIKIVEIYSLAKNETAPCHSMFQQLVKLYLFFCLLVCASADSNEAGARKLFARQNTSLNLLPLPPPLKKPSLEDYKNLYTAIATEFAPSKNMAKYLRFSIYEVFTARGGRGDCTETYSYYGNYDMELRDFVINKFTQLDFLQGGNIYHVTRSLFIIRL